MSQAQEVSIGQQQYAPTRQSQGGDFIADPKLASYVDGIGQRLAAQSERPDLPYEFKVLANGVPNAWALPGGKIAVNLGLLVALENEAQLAAVIGHEITHAAARHGAQGMERGMLLQGALQAVAIGTGGDPNAQWVMGAASLGANLVNQKYGRDAERESDLYGMRMMQRAGYDPAAAVELQEIFVKLSAGQDSSWLEGLFASHPPSVERVQANKAELARMRAEGLGGGERGEERYAARMAAIKKSAEGFDKLAKGEQALAAGRAKDALALADSAVALDPREARFQALRGNALLAEGDPQAAKSAFDRAVRLDSNYFATYLGQARALEALGDDAGAARAFAASAERLPTVEAEAKLGLLAEKSGNREAAIQHYGRVAQTQSPWSQGAAVQLARLQLSDHPEKYVVAGVQRDKRGFLILLVQNRAPFAVDKVEVQLRRSAKSEATPLVLPDRIEPGKTLARRTNLGPYADDEALSKVQLRVVGAQPADGV